MKQLSYFIGLWEGDGYNWSRSLGITNRNQMILDKASEILYKISKMAIKESYDSEGRFRVYINSSNFCRDWKLNVIKTKQFILSKRELTEAYFSGKYDADGCKWKLRNKFKITYNTNEKEIISFDSFLLNKNKIYHRFEKYKGRNAIDLVIPERSADNFKKLCSYSIKFSDER